MSWGNMQLADVVEYFLGPVRSPGLPDPYVDPRTRDWAVVNPVFGFGMTFACESLVTVTRCAGESGAARIPPQARASEAHLSGAFARMAARGGRGNTQPRSALPLYVSP